MSYDINKTTAPELPNLGKGLECIKLLLSQTSKDMHAPLWPMLFPALGAKISNVEFQYPSGQWLELCGQMAALCADSGNNKGQLGLLVEALYRDERRSDKLEINTYLEYQKTFKQRSNNRDKPTPPDLCLRFLPADTTRAGYLKAQMAAETNGGYTTYIDLPEIEMLDNLCGSHKQMTQILRLVYDRQIYQALRATVDGTLGRIVFSYKPRTNRDGKIPRIGKFSDEFYQQLDTYLARLALCKGRYIIRPLNKLIERLAVEVAELGDLTDNDCLWDMAKRSLVSAWKAGAVMWCLNNQTWTRSMSDVVEWLVWYDTWSKWQVMGDMLKDGDISTSENDKNKPANMLDSIEGITFSEQQLEALRMSLDKPKEGTHRQLRVWRNRDFIVQDPATGLWTKTEAYLNRS